MDGWTNIASFDRQHQAELRKDFLVSYGIETIILSEKDSTFLWGELELYVEEKHAEKAEYLLESFNGRTKINSFDQKDPVTQVQDYLESNGIDSVLLSKAEHPHLCNNYELFVDNDEAERARYLLTDMKGWQRVEILQRSKQAALRINMLSQRHIKTIVLNKRDSDFNIANIELYVEDQRFDIAQTILKKLADWSRIEDFINPEDAELQEGLLESHGLAALIQKQRDAQGNVTALRLYAEVDQAEKAREIIKQYTKWECVNSFVQSSKAEYQKELLLSHGITSVLVDARDRNFLFGEINLFVEEKNLGAARSLLAGLVQDFTLADE